MSTGDERQGFITGYIRDRALISLRFEHMETPEQMIMTTYMQSHRCGEVHAVHSLQEEVRTGVEERHHGECDWQEWHHEEDQEVHHEEILKHDFWKQIKREDSAQKEHCDEGEVCEEIFEAWHWHECHGHLEEDHKPIMLESTTTINSTMDQIRNTEHAEDTSGCKKNLVWGGEERQTNGGVTRRHWCESGHWSGGHGVWAELP